MSPALETDDDLTMTPDESRNALRMRRLVQEATSQLADVEKTRKFLKGVLEERQGNLDKFLDSLRETYPLFDQLPKDDDQAEAKPTEAAPLAEDGPGEGEGHGVNPDGKPYPLGGYGLAGEPHDKPITNAEVVATLAEMDKTDIRRLCEFGMHEDYVPMLRKAGLKKLDDLGAFLKQEPFNHEALARRLDCSTASRIIYAFERFVTGDQPSGLPQEHAPAADETIEPKPDIEAEFAAMERGIEATKPNRRPRKPKSAPEVDEPGRFFLVSRNKLNGMPLALIEAPSMRAAVAYRETREDKLDVRVIAEDGRPSAREVATLIVVGENGNVQSTLTQETTTAPRPKRERAAAKTKPRAETREEATL